jgi:hypothetical protein
MIRSAGAIPLGDAFERGRRLAPTNFEAKREWLAAYLQINGREETLHSTRSSEADDPAPAAFLLMEPFDAFMVEMPRHAIGRALTAGLSWRGHRPLTVGSRVGVERVVSAPYTRRGYEMMAVKTSAIDPSSGGLIASAIVEFAWPGPQPVPAKSRSAAEAIEVEDWHVVRRYRFQLDHSIALYEGHPPFDLNPHVSDEAARGGGWGMRRAFMSGPHLWSIVSDAMTEVYGPAWIWSGDLMLKYLGPVFTGDEVVVFVSDRHHPANEIPERTESLIRVTRISADDEQGVISLVAGGRARLAG